MMLNVKTTARVSQQWLTTREAAEVTGLHPETIREAVRERSLKARRKGHRGFYRISSQELQTWFNRTHRPA